ncbi:GNAT family N-acetyltransferase [Ferruginibacter paludis]|uniref:GNAT family N-acetyltransferase n=1 Tax=Ferruginibacter paludis TaxID=1310417 RepID=UPI0025B30642|nr:GNAT family N-acetyltransferase [Ferruginibacter paludis]MDN3656798.1 GNAT family N-acetyltransferase [Ferruginibacter paludis]
MGNFTISTDRAKLDVDLIHHFLSTEAYWSKGIPLSTVEAAIANSLNFGIYDGDQQAGYARIVSDFATVAYLGDVFILPEFRGKGLSKMLMQEVMNHPQLQGLRRWILLTGDAHGLYKQFGWSAIASPDKWMEKHCKDIYTLAASYVR